MQDRMMLQDLVQDPDIVKVTGGYGSAAPRARWRGGFRPFLAPDTPGILRRVIADRETPEKGLGIVMLTHMDSGDGTAEVYIKLSGSARGRGYGRDAVDALVSHAFQEMGLNQIRSSVLEHNTASRKLFEACGFWQENEHKGGADRDGQCRMVCSYVIKKDAMSDGDIDN